MALNTVLLIAAGIGTHIGLQDPGFDFQFAVPVIDGQAQSAPQQSPPPVKEPAVWAPVITEAPVVSFVSTTSQSKKVSVNFKSAKPSEVLAWLEKEGLSFVVADGAIPPSSTVTLNIVDQPVEDVANALAAALGGHWQRQGNVRVYRHGVVPGFMSAPRTGATTFEVRPFESKVFEKQFGPEFQKRIELLMKDMPKEMDPEFRKRIEAFTKDMEKHFGPEFQKRMSEHRVIVPKLENLEKLRELHVPGQHGREAEVSKKIAEAHVKQAKEHAELAKKMAEVHVKQGKEHAELAKKLSEAHGKQDKERAVAARKLAETHALRAKDKAATAKKLSEEHAKRAREMAQRELEIYRAKDGKLIRERALGADVIVRDRTGRVITPRSTRTILRSRDNAGDVKKLLSTLTPEQKHSQRMRGFVYYLDLSPEQRKLLGKVPQGRFEMKFNIDGETLVIKGG